MNSRRAAEDGGVTLIELIVSIVIAGIFGGLLVLMFVDGWGAQERSVSRDTATGQANVVKTTMADALRNATAVRVSDAGKRVDALVALPTASFTGAWTWECRAWVLTDKSLRYSAGATMRSTDPSTWASLAGKTPQRPRNKVEGTISGAPFALAGPKSIQVGIDITVAARDVQTVAVLDGMTAQTVATAAEMTGAPACWL